MKIAIIGAAGLRTPLIVQSIHARRSRLGLDELALMDIDDQRLELIGALTTPLERSPDIKFRILRTTDPILALKNADFVIPTFRVGGIESRMIDERVPLNHGILGQETTGAGGFAMGLRSIPVMLGYVKIMHEVCPDAWLINFANPAGMLTEAVIRHANWTRVVGICDAPTSMHSVIAAIMNAKPEEVYLDYFGLNHLGWIKRILYRNHDYLPDFLESILSTSSLPGLPFDPQLVYSLGMIPNEYLYYYYYANQSVNNILKAGESRGEQVAKLNLHLLNGLKEKFDLQDYTGMQAAYHTYLNTRGSTYMARETGKTHDLSILEQKIIENMAVEGYAGVALNLIEALTGDKPTIQILNVANRGAMAKMDKQDVVEIPTLVTHDHIQPMAVGEIPAHCMGLIEQVKHFEHLTIEAAIEKSYQKALLALTIHPLVRDYSIATSILNKYISSYKGSFPELK